MYYKWHPIVVWQQRVTYLTDYTSTVIHDIYSNTGNMVGFLTLRVDEMNLSNIKYSCKSELGKLQVMTLCHADMVYRLDTYGSLHRVRLCLFNLDMVKWLKIRSKQILEVSEVFDEMHTALSHLSQVSKLDCLSLSNTWLSSRRDWTTLMLSERVNSVTDWLAGSFDLI